jgi:leucyl-tRNA synthetase
MNSQNSYNAPKTEKKWQELWEKKKLYDIDLKNTKKSYYNLVMFPYPSGDKLHIGHWYNFSPSDSFGRYKRMKGFNVFEPMGFDAFGLPTENYAIKTGIAPPASTATNVKTMIRQLKAMGTMYDWSQTANTSTPEYYKWTQWLFLQMYKRGLAYKKKSPVNWCPGCKTVLANEQVEEGVCERCKKEVTKKDLAQWFWRITDYADKLLDYEGLEWPEKTITMQKNWIGRSEGSNISFDVEDFEEKIDVFTTRIDTLQGCTYMVLAPEHPLVKKLTTKKYKEKVADYVKESRKKSDIERTAEDRVKTGVFTGSYAVNPINGKSVPVWIADYVLFSYGTGAVMAVPAHDERDFAFATKYKLDIIPVIAPADGAKLPKILEEAFTDDGVLFNSKKYDGMKSAAARKAMTGDLKKKSAGDFVVNYRLHDWLVSRQRYWGAPIPVINCEKCGEVPVPEKDLPVVLPRIKDYKPKGKAPLATSTAFMKTKCPKCKGRATREPDTMDTFVCSSWYYLRYPCANLKGKPFTKETLKNWSPVDMYIGGPEHACMHLLYARFVNHVLFDAGLIPSKEPFKRLIHQGMVTKDGAKMSKSKGNVVSPDSFVEQYGSDVFRMYLMFMGPFTQGGDWNDKGITGIARFVQKFWRMIESPSLSKISDDTRGLLHRTIKKVTSDIEGLQFNTALAALMEFTNQASREGLDDSSKKILAQLIAPMAPHLAEELWNSLNDGKWTSIFDSTWPKFNEKHTAQKTIKLIIQINGKVRGTVDAAADISKDDAIKLAYSLENVQRFMEGKKVVKEIFVPGKLVSFVIA